MKKFNIYFIAAALLSLAACKTEDTFDGPSLNDLYGAFSIKTGLAISNDNVNFSAGETTFFTAEFSKSVDWTLQIKGLTSGAQKEITGFSNILDASNALWNGTTTDLPMFKLEECAIALIIPEAQDTLRDTLTIAGTRVNDGFLLSDFENGTNAGWVPFVQTGANMSFSVASTDVAAQGNSYFDIGGVVNWDWLIGMIDMPATAYGPSTSYDLPENPDNVYFNAMLYKHADLSNGLMLFQFREDDNGDGVYTSSNEDMFSLQVNLSTGSGWSLESIRYSDLQTLVNGAAAAAIGNGVHEPSKLFQVSVLFLANPTSGYAHAYMDYLIFTNNGPLQP